MNGFGGNIDHELAPHTVHHRNIEVSSSAVEQDCGYFAVRTEKCNGIQVYVTGNGINANGAFGNQLRKVSDGIEHGLFVEFLKG